MRRWYPVAAVVLALAASLAVFGRLPERVPTHWNASGEIDGWGRRATGAFTIPVVMAFVALLIPVIPRVDPRGESYEKFRPSYLLVMNVVLTFMLGLHVVLLSAMLGARPPVGRLVPFGVGAMFAVMGNVLPRTRPNWTFGIRTPWTLSSDRVWHRTHRVGGYLMVGGGIATMGAALVLRPEATVAVLIASITAASLGSVAYSYLAWREERR